MGLYQIIKENDICISLHHGVEEDSSIYFDINEAITYSDKLIEGIEQTTAEVTSIDNLLDYFAVKRIAEFEKVLPNIENDTEKTVINGLCFKAGEAVKKYSTGNIIRYINSEHEAIIKKGVDNENDVCFDVQKILFPLVEFCIQYQSGISAELFLCLAKKHPYIYIIYYDKLKKKLLNSWDLFDEVFSENNIHNLMGSKCQKLLLISKNINSMESVDEKIKNAINDRIYSCTIAIMKSAQKRDTIAYGDSVRRIRRFFTEIDYDQQKLAEFEDIHCGFNNRLEEWIKNNGGVFQQPIPAGITEKIFECDVEWILKLLMLTNKLEGRSIKNIFSFSPSKGTILIDRISINRDTDEYFTYTRQQNIQIAASIGAVLIMEIFENEKYLDEFINWVIAALKYISDHCKLRDEEIDIDFLTMVESLQFVDAVRKENKKDTGSSLIYGSSMLIMACIEKILRLIYKFENKIVLSDELIQLGGLLDNPIIEKVLTKDLMKGIGFYLSKYGYIGLNYRNKFSHLSDISINEIHSILPYILFYLYLALINGILIYYCDGAGNE